MIASLSTAKADGIRLRGLCFSAVVALFTSAWLSPIALAAGELRVHCTPVAAKALAEMATHLHEKGIEVKLDFEGGSSVAIAALSVDRIDLAVTVRPMTAQERSADPEKHFAERVVAYQALAVIVPVDVWSSGVREITKDQAALIYEGRTKSWKELGGEDRPIKFYNPEQGKGLWEPYVTWLYGDVRKAGLGAAFEAVGSGEDARNAVEFNGGSLSVAPIGLVDSRAVYALALKDDRGTAIPPSMDEIVKQRYPLSRPIIAITGERPTGTLRRMLDYMATSEGQEIFKAHGLVAAPPDAPLTP